MLFSMSENEVSLCTSDGFNERLHLFMIQTFILKFSGLVCHKTHKMQDKGNEALKGEELPELHVP